MSRQLEILIVDDEENIREGLRYLIDWEACGYHVIGTAKHGGEALRICREDKVDVVLTDIRMPVMDGLMLAEKLYEERRDIVVVIMSAYQDFSYAQQAIRFHVQSYILKPIVSKQLEKELAVIRKKPIYGEKQRQRRQEFLKKVIFSQIGEEEKAKISCQAEEAEIEIKNVVFQCVQLRCGEEKEKVFHDTCLCMEENGLGYGCQDLEGNLVLLFVLPRDKKQDADRLILLLKEELERENEVPFLMAAGECVEEPEYINKSYRQTNNLFFLNLFEEGEKIRFCSEFLLEKKRSIAAEFESLFSFVEAGQMHEIKESAKNLLDRAVREHITKVELYGAASQLFGRLSETISSFSYEEIWDEMLKQKTISELVDYLCKISLESADKRKGDEPTGSLLLVKKVEEFIEEHISDTGLNTKYIAGELGYNSAYLGRVFLSEREISVKECINRKRIELVCRQLSCSSDSITEIAFDTGYQDISSFYEIFKKIKGITPKEYREKNRGKK